MFSSLTHVVIVFVFLESTTYPLDTRRLSLPCCRMSQPNHQHRNLWPTSLRGHEEIPVFQAHFFPGLCGLIPSREETGRTLL